MWGSLRVQILLNGQISQLCYLVELSVKGKVMFTEEISYLIPIYSLT